MVSQNERVYSMTFASVYPLYVQKVERKGQSRESVDAVICWLTGYTEANLDKLKESKTTLRDFFENAPQIHPHANLISGVICGYRVENIEDPLMQKIRWMDKLIDEVAKGKAIEKILR